MRVIETMHRKMHFNIVQDEIESADLSTLQKSAIYLMGQSNELRKTDCSGQTAYMKAIGLGSEICGLLLKKEGDIVKHQRTGSGDLE